MIFNWPILYISRSNSLYVSSNLLRSQNSLKVTYLTSSLKSVVAYKFEGSGRKVVKICLFYFMRPDGDRPVLGKRFKALIISQMGNHIDFCDCIENNEGCSLKTIWRSAQFRESSRWNAFHNILPILHQIERELGSKLKRVFGEYISTPAILDFRERTFS